MPMAATTELGAPRAALGLGAPAVPRAPPTWLRRLGDVAVGPYLHSLLAAGLDPIVASSPSLNRHTAPAPPQLARGGESLPQQFSRAECAQGLATATVQTYDSYTLGAHGPESDIDLLCLGPCIATLQYHFFVVLRPSVVYWILWGLSREWLGHSYNLLSPLTSLGIVTISAMCSARDSASPSSQIVMHWANAVAYEQSVPQGLATATVLTYDSYTLGAHGPESDIDLLCLGP
ncbi:hypothetical protein ZEAMMB73_Zm00001d000142 [Zea mays]|nr:hypothetical protein ZEAMMB73_Zm00001d000142 [Zea mays]